MRGRLTRLVRNTAEGRVCPKCGGFGKVRQYRPREKWLKCSKCDGKGIIR